MNKRSLTISVLLAFVLCISYTSVHSDPLQVSQVSFIDVGQGDSALLQDPNGFDILIDGGPSSAGPALVNDLRTLGVDSLEVILATHADADHVGGLISVLDAVDISVGVIYFNGYPGTTQTWNNFVARANTRSIPMLPAQFPLELTWGEFDVYVLNPPPGLSNPSQNDASVVARIDYLDTQFLFSGDIDFSVEDDVIARQTPVAADVLKVAHHGSAYGSSEEFLAAVNPDNGVISVGNNSYGHPSPDTLARLNTAQIQVWRTDKQGTIIVTTDGFTVTFPNQPPPLGFVIYLPAVVKPAPALP